MMDSTIVIEILKVGATIIGSIFGFAGVVYVQKKKSVDEHLKLQDNFQKSVEGKLDAHREEYLQRVADVETHLRENLDNLTDMRAKTQNWQSVMEIKMDNLEEKVTKHNNIVERMQKAELNIAILQQREKVSEHRLKDLEYEDD